MHQAPEDDMAARTTTTSPTTAARTPRTTTAVTAVTAGLGVALLLSACAGEITGGAPATEEREVEGVTAVALETSGDLVVELGDTPSLTITAPQRVLDRLTSDVEDGLLVLGTDRAGWSWSGEVDYRLVVTDLEAVHVRGSGDVEVDEALTADAFEVDVEGSGDVSLADLDVDALQVVLTGSGGVELAGRAATMAASLSGSGGLDADDLTVGDATVDLEGSGDADVHVTDRLAVQVTGSGVVTHTGGADVDQQVTGSGGVREG